MTDRTYSVLVIDDLPENIETIFEVLNENNYKAYVATNGEKGFAIAKKRKPSLIITDWDMPGLSGIETIRMLKNDKQTAAIPIIMATGKMTSSEDLRTALDAGAMDYVRKPIDPIELEARVRSTIVFIEEMNKTIALEKYIVEKEKRELEAKLEESRQKLMNVSMQLVQSSKSVQEIIEQLGEFADNSLLQKKNTISDLTSYIQSNLYSFNWQEFETVFNQVHTDFYNRLTDKHRNLSKNEHNLCAFLRLNMSSKDISSITFQSQEAIIKARYRLRKKLGLGTDDNLNTYLQQF